MDMRLLSWPLTMTSLDFCWVRPLALRRAAAAASPTAGPQEGDVLATAAHGLWERGSGEVVKGVTGKEVCQGLQKKTPELNVWVPG